jgi:hypothetical protein
MLRGMATASRPLLRRPITWVALVVVAVVVAVGLYLFQPWKLFVNQTVDEGLPTATPPAAGAPVQAGSEPAAASTEPKVLATGDLITHEHTTTGTVQLLELPDGSKIIRLQDLNTSNGPLLKVFLTDAPVIEGTDGWGVFDDGRYVDLGDLKGNIGSSNYVIPADADIAGLDSVSIWCDRFDVSFGAATLT